MEVNASFSDAIQKQIKVRYLFVTDSFKLFLHRPCPLENYFNTVAADLQERNKNL